MIYRVFIPALCFGVLIAAGAFLLLQPPASESELTVVPVTFEQTSGRLIPGDLIEALVPHKALYEIHLTETRSGSQIINIGGRMFYEWQPGCEAWVSNHSFSLRYEYADSPPMNITSDFSTFESFDGRTLHFTSVRRRDGRVFEELRGHADSFPGKPGKADYSVPDDLEHDLPAGTLFPIGHTLGVMQAIKDGKSFYRSVIFDGSDEEGPVEINAFLGKPVNAIADIEASPGIDMALVNTPAHHVRLAFFPLGETEADPDYEMSTTFHENGVISAMTIEYDDFTVQQKLVALEKLSGVCGKPDMSAKQSEEPQTADTTDEERVNE